MDGELIEKLLIKTRQDADRATSAINGEWPQMILSKDLFPEGQEIYVNLHSQDVNPKKYWMHGHDFFEINYVVQGEGQQIIDRTQSIKLTRGMLCIMNPNARHNLYVEHSRDLVLNIALKPTLFNATFWSLIGEHEILSPFFLNYFLAQDRTQDFLIFHFHQDADMDHLISDLCREVLEDAEYSHVSERCLLTLLFTNIVRQAAKLQEQKEFKDRSEVMITSLYRYLSVNYATATLESTAHYLHYHPNYLSASIRKATGKTFRQIRNEILVQQCIYLLVNTNYTIREVSDQLGFSELANFYAFTRKNFHTTPTAYRQMHRPAK